MQCFREQFSTKLLAVHLKDALTSLSTLTGKSVTEQMLDEVFKQFCVGK